MKYRFPDRIRMLRAKHKMTQAELAKKANLSQSTIAQIETSRKDPSLSSIYRLALALKVHVSVFFIDKFEVSI